MLGREEVGVCVGRSHVGRHYPSSSCHGHYKYYLTHAAGGRADGWVVGVGARCRPCCYAAVWRHACTVAATGWAPRRVPRWRACLDVCPALPC